MLNEQTRKDFDLRLDEIESGLDSDDIPLRVMASLRSSRTTISDSACCRSTIKSRKTNPSLAPP